MEMIIDIQPKMIIMSNFTTIKCLWFILQAFFITKL
jgi:hypothetical protein